MNGYKNRATWNVALWLGNEESFYKAAKAFRQRHGKLNATAARILCNELFGEETPDGCELKNVNWKEVANAVNDF